MQNDQIKIDNLEYYDKLCEEIINSEEIYFITGKAGTGKSTFLRFLIGKISEANFAVVAPTGVAALNVEGQTIHSFFGFSTGVTEEEVAVNASKTRNKELFKKLEYLIIDEVSMLRADMLDYINIFLRKVRKKLHPFGGVKVIMIGDLFQLPPVVMRDEYQIFKELYKSPYFFHSKIIYDTIKSAAGTLRFIEFEKIYRQSEEEFINILNAIRTGEIDKDSLIKLNSRIAEPRKKAIRLVTTNQDAENLNKKMLESIENEEFISEGFTTGNFENKNTPTDISLRLKKGARVMFVKNDTFGRWVNGSIGEIIDVKKEGVKIGVLVKLEDGEEVEVTRESWTSYRSFYDKKVGKIEREIVGSFTQIPLKLAWAVTIHKSQGQTFDYLHLDMGRGAFAHGQTYVALSRSRTLNGLTLSKEIEQQDIIVDNRIVGFYKWMQSRVG